MDVIHIPPEEPSQEGTTSRHTYNEDQLLAGINDEAAPQSGIEDLVVSSDQLRISAELEVTTSDPIPASSTNNEEEWTVYEDPEVVDTDGTPITYQRIVRAAQRGDAEEQRRLVNIVSSQHQPTQIAMELLKDVCNQISFMYQELKDAYDQRDEEIEREIEEVVELAKRVKYQQNKLEESQQQGTALAVRGPNKIPELNKTGCYFCQGTHGASACEQYQTADARRKLIEEQGRCIECLSWHDTSECTNLKVNINKLCKGKNCQANKHHLLLCQLKYTEEAARKKKEDREKQEQKQKEEEQKDDSEVPPAGVMLDKLFKRKPRKGQ